MYWFKNIFIATRTCFIFLALLSCAEKSAEDFKSAGNYFDIPGHVGMVTKELGSSEQVFEKTMIYNGEEDAQTINFDTAGWEKELEYFSELNINNSRYADQLKVTESNENGVLKRRYENEKFKQDGIEYVELALDENTEKVVSLWAHYQEDNAIYSLDRYLKMEFSPKNENLLLNYSIEGSQKILFSKPVHYSIAAEIRR